jgi:hypothetical protein
MLLTYSDESKNSQILLGKKPKSYTFFVYEPVINNAITPKAISRKIIW